MMIGAAKGNAHWNDLHVEYGTRPDHAGIVKVCFELKICTVFCIGNVQLSLHPAEQDWSAISIPAPKLLYHSFHFCCRLSYLWRSNHHIILPDTIHKSYTPTTLSSCNETLVATIISTQNPRQQFHADMLLYPHANTLSYFHTIMSSLSIHEIIITLHYRNIIVSYQSTITPSPFYTSSSQTEHHFMVPFYPHTIMPR